MRIYKNFEEAMEEIKRDLAEMGIRVHPQTYQDKFVGDNDEFETREITNYIYTVVEPQEYHLKPTQPWAEMEFKERLEGVYGSCICTQNPGKAWLERKDVWEQFLQEDGTFAYTYGERLARSSQLTEVIGRLRTDPDSRQCFISIWDPCTDPRKMGGISRIPCTLGYLVQVRRGKLDLTYLQRSSDFATHLVNDVYLAFLLQEWIAGQVGVPVGNFTHWLGSLHIFAKDTKEVF